MGAVAPIGLQHQPHPLLAVEKLQTFFFTRHGVVKAVDGMTFSLDAAETLAIVGESGCGKTVTALSLMRLVPDPPGFGTALILITHDLGVVAETAQRVIVMYAGRKVEEASVQELFAQPLHPYTRGLLASIPRLPLLRSAVERTRGRLAEIPGMVPSLAHLPAGCAFAPRCAFAIDQCRSEYPPYEQKRPAHWAACWRSDALCEADHAS
jgi:peptide/nickel transport system ATP-binding protein